MALVRDYWRSLGLTASAMDTMLERWTSNTRALYAREFAKFLAWRGGDTTKVVTPIEVVNYLDSCKGYAIRTLKVKSAAILAVPKATDRWSDPSDLVSRFLQGACKAQPSQDHRADPIPSLQPLFAWLSKSRDTASRKVSRLRAVILCRFVTLARSKDLEGWLADSVDIQADKIVVRTERTKGQPVSRSYIIPRYPDDVNRCPYVAFLDYWSLMQPLGTSPYVWRTAGSWRSAQTMYDYYVRRPEAGANVARVLYRLFDEADGEDDTL